MKKFFLLLTFTATLQLHASTQSELYNYPVDIPDNATEDEISSYRALKAAYYASLPSANSASAEAYVASLKADSWSAVPTGNITQAQLANIAKNIRDLARAANKGTTSAQSALNELLNALTLRGYKGVGGINFSLATNDYTSCVDIVQGCTEGASMYSGSRKSDWLNFIRRICEFGQVYNPNYLTELNTDYMYNVAPNLFYYPFVVDEENLGIQHLKACSRYMNRFVEPTDGKNDGLKIDGTGFHHGTHYPNYLYCFQRWFIIAERYRNTPFRISEGGFQGIKSHVMCMYLTATKPTGSSYSYLANSLSGRNPYLNGGIGNQVSKADFETLLELGKDVTGNYDTDLAKAYNYFFDVNSSTYSTSKADLDGFYQFNYSPVGVLRKGSWVATMRAPTVNFFGSEMYISENRFGAYQSHGSLEIMYKGDAKASGIASASDCGGWDWNIVPGATVVLFTKWTDMMPNKNTTQRCDQYSAKNFSGALAAEKTGIFATDFEQGNVWGSGQFTSTALKFKKSYFAFDSIIVALGSNISSGGTVTNTGNTVTNLFQNIIHPVSGSFIHNGSTINTTQTTTTSNNTAPNWFVTPAGTGYFVPKGQPVTFIYGSQTTPKETGADAASPTATTTAAKAYLDHGKVPTSAKYEFVVLPGATAASMTTLASSIGNMYTIIQQDNKAHILKVGKQTGYAAFAALTGLTGNAITAIDAASLVSLTEKHTDTLALAVSIPDLTFDSNGNAIDKAVTITMNGFWYSDYIPQNVKIQHIQANNICKITITAQKGLGTYMTLYKSSYVPPTGINGSRSNLDVKVYPNPTHDVVRVLLPKVPNKPVTVNVYNTEGQLQKRVIGIPEHNEVEVDLRSLNTGIYYLQVKVGKELATPKVLKQ